MISKPPGVKMMPIEIQNPPYDERTVAPNEFPTAISLPSLDGENQTEQTVSRQILPHAS